MQTLASVPWILRHKAKRIPVIVSMGNVAASGGYWVATPGDFVFAEPSTVTGSIGVFGVLPSFEGTLQRIGVGGLEAGSDRRLLGRHVGTPLEPGRTGRVE